MTLGIYTARRGGDGAQLIPAPASVTLGDPESYVPADGVKEAVNVALALGQPLLLTGEPGCGKTQLASNLAWSLGLTLRKFETKSDSTSESLFYRYDSLRHFESSSRGEPSDPLRHISWNALGAAILATLPAEEQAAYSVDGIEPTPRRSVVLIDEIDKAPRDFPNDVLNELEHLYFRVPEIGNTVIRADNAHRPIVVITSNSERDLPEPFLRRCVFHHITFPDDETVRRIALNHLGAHVRDLDALLDEAVSFFAELRADSTGLSRRPGLAEFLNWLVVLGQHDTARQRLTTTSVRATIGVLVKTTSDLRRAEDLLTTWLSRRDG